MGSKKPPKAQKKNGAAPRYRGTWLSEGRLPPSCEVVGMFCIPILVLILAIVAFMAIPNSVWRMMARDSAWLSFRVPLGLPCSMKVVDASRFTLAQMQDAIEEAGPVPLVLRGAANQWPVTKIWQDRLKFLERHGNFSLGVGAGAVLAQRDGKEGLTGSWTGPASGAGVKEGRVHESASARGLRARFKAMADAGETPSLKIAELAARVRSLTMPHDSYAFTPVDGSALAADMPELLDLWKNLADAGKVRTPEDKGKLQDSALFGLGGPGSGVMFHAHRFAVNALLVGHKRWFTYYQTDMGGDAFTRKIMDAVTKKNPKFGIDAFASWLEEVYPLPAHQEKWTKYGFECVQEPGDIIYVPQAMVHGTYNIDETLGLALQGGGYRPIKPR